MRNVTTPLGRGADRTLIGYAVEDRPCIDATLTATAARIDIIQRAAAQQREGNGPVEAGDAPAALRAPLPLSGAQGPCRDTDPQG